VTERAGVIAAFLRIANFEDQLHGTRIPETADEITERGIQRVTIAA